MSAHPENNLQATSIPRHPHSVAGGEINSWLSYFNQMAAHSTRLFASPFTTTAENGAATVLPRYIYFGQNRETDAPRIGIVAGFEGNGNHSVLSLLRLLEHLILRPESAAGFNLFIYPIWALGTSDGSVSASIREAVEGEILRHHFNTIIRIGAASGLSQLRGAVQGISVEQSFFLGNHWQGQGALASEKFVFPVDWIKSLKTDPAPFPSSHTFTISLEFPTEWSRDEVEVTLVQTIKTFLHNYSSSLAIAINL
ncbi:MAG: hypothetical protein SFY80_00030 [Verrucomicrobiota bacterium]|nr:hypothetical protein [Verrucomicrobiota bacterium]